MAEIKSVVELDSELFKMKEDFKKYALLLDRISTYELIRNNMFVKTLRNIPRNTRSVAVSLGSLDKDLRSKYMEIRKRININMEDFQNHYILDIKYECQEQALRIISILNCLGYKYNSDNSSLVGSGFLYIHTPKDNYDYFIRRNSFGYIGRRMYNTSSLKRYLKFSEFQSIFDPQENLTTSLL